MTGLAGFAWFIYISATPNSVKFSNDTIQYQIPLLIIVVIAKYLILFRNSFKSHRSVFRTNLVLYASYVAVVLLIDIKIK